MSRTTHSDLAAIVRAHSKALAKVPPVYCVGDASTLNSLEAASALLVEQDERIERLTIALRAARSSLKTPTDSERREAALSIVNIALGKA